MGSGGIHRTVKAVAERLFVQHCDPQLLAGVRASVYRFSCTLLSHDNFFLLLRIGSCIHTQP